MRRFAMISAGLATCLVWSDAMAAKPTTPPMDDFNNAFYTCDNEGAFLISYDSDKPSSATLTTSNNSKRYELKKTAVATGTEFSGGNVKFWTDGDTVTVVGTEVALQNCKRKTN